MIIKYVTAALIVLSLSACAVSHKQLDSNPAFTTHQYNSSDMDIIWKTEKLNNALLIEGTVFNPTESYAYKAVTLEATILGVQGEVLGGMTVQFLPVKFKGPEPFKMNIPLEKDMQPESIKFNYRYAIDEDHFSVYFKSKP